MVLYGAPVVPKNLAIWYTDGSNLEIRGCGAIEVWKNVMTSFSLGYDSLSVKSALYRFNC